MSSDSPLDFTSVKWDREQEPSQHDESHGVETLAEFATDHPWEESSDLEAEAPEAENKPDENDEHEELTNENNTKTFDESVDKNSDAGFATENFDNVDENNSLHQHSDELPPSDRESEETSRKSRIGSPEVTENGEIDRASGQSGPAEPAPEQQTEGALQAELQQLKSMEEAASKYTVASQVSNPISDRDGNAKAFISYLVTTDTDHPDIKKLSGQTGEGTITVKVRRRYGDFRFLHDCLTSDFPQALVPPLPPKSNIKYLTGDTFSTQFVHKRLHSLDRFVAFICQHKLLSQSSVYHYFISDSAEWATFTKNLKISKTDDGDSSLVGKVVNEELMTETVMNFFTSSKHKRETNKDILEISDKLKKLYENLLKLDRIFSKLNKKNTDLKGDYEQFSAQINKLALLHDSSQASESLPGDSNSSFVSSIEGGLSNNTTNFKIFSESLLYFSQNWSGLSQYIDESFLVSLKDCAKYIVRLTDLIELQHNKKIDLQVLQDYLKKARNDLASIGGAMGDTHGNLHSPPPNPSLLSHGNGGIVNNTTQLIKDTLSTSATAHIGSSQSENKKWKLRQRIAQLEGEIGLQTQLVNNLTSRIINEEYPNWDRFNKLQLKKSMTELCDHEIDFYKGLADNWTEVENKLLKRLDELS